MCPCCKIERFYNAKTKQSDYFVPICIELGGFVKSYKGRSQLNVDNINENHLPLKFMKMLDELEKEFIESC